MATYRAIAVGYAGGRIIKPGENVPEGTPKGSWMEEIEEKRKPGRPPKVEEKTETE